MAVCTRKILMRFLARRPPQQAPLIFHQKIFASNNLYHTSPSVKSNIISDQKDITVDVDKQIDNLLSTLKKNKFSPTQLSKLTNLMNSDSNNHEYWLNACERRPDLLNYDIGFLIQVKNTLVAYFELTTEDEQFEVITHIPNAIYESKDINSILEATKLKAFCDQRDIDFSEWIAEYPLLLMMEIEKIIERCDSELPDYFASKKEVGLAVKNMPSILSAHWPDLKAKLEFIVHEMQVFPGTLAKTKSLEYDLQHIKDRYEFLNRAGLYQHPSLKSKSASIAEAYPLISDVVETELPNFIQEVAGNGFTITDYEFFVKLLNEEFDDEDERDYYLENGFVDEEAIEK